MGLLEDRMAPYRNLCLRGDKSLTSRDMSLAKGESREAEQAAQSIGPLGFRVVNKICFLGVEPTRKWHLSH
jgi:hypothetical protein